MEIRPRVGKPDRLSVAPAVRQDQDVRIVGMVELVDHVRLGRTEPPGEGDVLRGRQRLLAQDQNLRPEERLLELDEFGVGQSPRGIDGGGFQTETRAKRFRWQHGGRPT